MYDLHIHTTCSDCKYSRLEIIVFYYLYSIITFNFSILFWLLFSIPYLWSIASYINLKYEGFNKDIKIMSFIAFLLSPIWFFLDHLSSSCI